MSKNWIPEIGEKFWSVMFKHGISSLDCFWLIRPEGFKTPNSRYKFNTFRTKKQAQETLKAIKEILR